MPKTCLITGISGYLGRNLAKELLKQNWQVNGFDLIKLKEFNNLPLKFFLGDIRDYEKLSSATKNVEVIFHLVGIMPQAKATAKTMNAINVGGTRNVLKQAVKNKVKRVVFLSSCEIYRWDKVPAKESLNENPRGIYGKNKLACELLGKKYSQKYGIEFISLRPSTIVGKNMTDYLFRNVMKGILKLPCFFYLGDGSNRFQMSATSDVVSACILAAEKENLKFEIFNIGADNPPPLKKQIKQIAKKLGLTKKYISLPAKPTKIFLHFLSKLGVSPFVPDHFEVMDKDIVMDCSKAKEILGWKPKISNVDMIVEAVLSYKEEIERNNF